MHIRTKFDGGKVINRSQSGSQVHGCWVAPEHGHELGATGLEKNGNYFTKQSIY